MARKSGHSSKSSRFEKEIAKASPKPQDDLHRRVRAFDTSGGRGFFNPRFANMKLLTFDIDMVSY